MLQMAVIQRIILLARHEPSRRAVVSYDKDGFGSYSRLARSPPTVRVAACASAERPELRTRGVRVV